MAIPVTLAWPARAALQTLTPVARERVDEALELIRQGQAAASTLARPFTDDGGRTLFMFRLGDGLRVVFYLSEDGAVIRDILGSDFAGRMG